jgi:hypothetical protein
MMEGSHARLRRLIFGDDASIGPSPALLADVLCRFSETLTVGETPEPSSDPGDCRSRLIRSGALQEAILPVSCAATAAPGELPEVLSALAACPLRVLTAPSLCFEHGEAMATAFPALRVLSVTDMPEVAAGIQPAAWVMMWERMARGAFPSLVELQVCRPLLGFSFPSSPSASASDDRRGPAQDPGPVLARAFSGVSRTLGLLRLDVRAPGDRFPAGLAEAIGAALGCLPNLLRLEVAGVQGRDLQGVGRAVPAGSCPRLSHVVVRGWKERTQAVLSLIAALPSVQELVLDEISSGDFDASGFMTLVCELVAAGLADRLETLRLPRPDQDEAWECGRRVLGAFGVACVEAQCSS